MEDKKKEVLKIHSMSVVFHRDSKDGIQTDLQVISDLCLTLYSGEILAVVGASGSGKSILAASILGILPENTTIKGDMYYKGHEITKKYQKELRGKEIALVPQSVSYLDPLMKVGKQVEGHWNTKLTEKRKNIFRRFQLLEEVEELYPFQLSGGMARRVLVSTALMQEATLIIADEPTPGMAMEQALEVLKMFREMANQKKAVLFITHDIDLAVEFADRIAVFYAGTAVEIIETKAFRNGVKNLKHPYTKALWEALPQNGFVPIPGCQPYPGSLQTGCLFAPRCLYAVEECKKQMPPVKKSVNGEVRCYLGT